MMLQSAAQIQCQVALESSTVRLQELKSYLPTPNRVETTYLCWDKDVIKGIGGDWEDLVKDVKGRIQDKEKQRAQQLFEKGGER